ALLKALETGTLSQAAEELGYSQSGLTRALNALEEQFGFRILKRDRSGVQLTAEGQLLLPYIRTVLYDQYRLEECVNEINGLRAGLIRIGTFNSVSAQWLPGIIQSFHTDYPEIRFELLHGTNEQIEEWIGSGRVDIGFIKYPPDTEMDSEFLYRDPIVSIFAAEDPHAGLSSFSLRQLPELPYIALNEGVDDEITAVLEANGIQPDTRFIESDDHAVVAMVEQGLGTSLMSMMMIQGFSRQIAAVPLDPPAWRDLGIGFRDRKSLSGAAAAFLQYTRQWLAENGYRCEGSR
ncbi:MAG: LysR family transcriptional regulator, partial [Anaerovoracaceae bacterium]